MRHGEVASGGVGFFDWAEIMFVARQKKLEICKTCRHNLKEQNRDLILVFDRNSKAAALIRRDPARTRGPTFEEIHFPHNERKPNKTK